MAGAITTGIGFFATGIDIFRRNPMLRGLVKGGFGKAGGLAGAAQKWLGRGWLRVAAFGVLAAAAADRDLRGGDFRFLCRRSAQKPKNGPGFTARWWPMR